MPSDLLKPPTPLVKVFSHDDAKGNQCGLQLQKMVERLVDERLRKVLPRFEDAVVQRVLSDRLQQEVDSKLTCVTFQLEAIYQEVTGLRSSCGCPSSPEQEALQGRMQQADALAGQWQGRIAGLQAELRAMQRESPSAAAKGASGGGGGGGGGGRANRLVPADCESTGSSAEDKAAERRPTAKAKSMDPRPDTKSKGPGDNLWKMRQLLTEQFVDKSKSQSGSQCSTPESPQEADLRELHFVAEKEEGSARKGGNSFLHLVKEQIGDSQRKQSCKDAADEGQSDSLSALNLERLSACSTVTLFDTQSQSKDDGTLSQGSFSFFSESA